MPGLDKVNNCYEFLQRNTTFNLSQFMQATSYSATTSKKYLGSQLALYVQKNGKVYEVVRELPRKDKFQKLLRQTSRPLNGEINLLIEKSMASALSAIAHYNSPYTQGKAASYIPQMFIAITSLVISAIKKYGFDNELYEKDAQGSILQVDGKNKIKNLIDLLKTYKSIPNIQLDDAEIKTFTSLLDLLRVVRNEIEHGSGVSYKLDILLDSKCHALLMNYERLLNREFDVSINSSLVFPLFISEKLSEEQKLAARSLQQKEYKAIKDIINTFNSALDKDVLANNFYDFKIWAIPKSSNRERNADISIEYVNIDDLSDEQKEKIERNFIAVREKTISEYRPSKFAEMVKNKIEKTVGKKILSFTSGYHLNKIIKVLKWSDNKEYRATNPTYKMDYYTEKARVELFRMIEQNAEEIVGYSKAKFSS